MKERKAILDREYMYVNTWFCTSDFGFPYELKNIKAIESAPHLLLAKKSFYQPPNHFLRSTKNTCKFFPMRLFMIGKTTSVVLASSLAPKES